MTCYTERSSGYSGFTMTDAWLCKHLLFLQPAKTFMGHLLGKRIPDLHQSYILTHPWRLVLMTYHGVVLLMSGYQADEAHIVKQYQAIVDE